MSKHGGIFDDLETVETVEEEPDFNQTIDEYLSSNQDKKNASLFISRDSMLNYIDKVKDIQSQLDVLFSELGDGHIDESLTIERRNQIIELIIEKQFDLQEYFNDMSEDFNKNLKRVNNLRVISTTSTEGLESLLATNKQKRKLTSKDLSFQR